MQKQAEKIDDLKMNLHYNIQIHLPETIAAFENMVRKFVVKVLLEHKGENWRDECVSDKIKKFSSFRHTLYFFRHGVTANPEIVYFFWKHIRVPNTLLSF